MSVRCRWLVAALIMASVLNSGCQSQKSPYSPEEALKTFQLPEGFRIELVAAEPEVVNPIAMAFDERGRLYVVEMGDYPISDEPLSRIKLLEDRDGDGRYEHSTVFVDDLHFAHGVMPWKEGVIVTCAPDIVYYKDTDGDGKADERTVILTGFAQVNPQLRVNAPTYGIDNWIYAAYPRFGKGNRFKQFSDLGKPIHYPAHPEVPPVDIFAKGMDLRFKPDQLKIEAISGNSEFGLAFDTRGHRFPSWNDKHAQHVVIENRYLARNPYLAVGSAVQNISDHGASAEVYPITDSTHLAHLKEIRSTALISELGHFTSACGQSIYTGSSFPEKYEGAYFVCEPVSNLVHCDLLTPQGATFTAKREREKSEFLASKDSWFKPVFTTVGPDGALYVVDFYRKIVEHPEWIRKEYVNDRKLFYTGNDRGRIYRIVHENSRRTSKPRLNEANTSELVNALSSRQLWWRITSQRLLIERKDTKAIPALIELAKNGAQAEGRMHALWTLAGLEGIDAELIVNALQDESPIVREQAVLLAENYLSDPPVTRKLLQMSGDPDDRVVFQLACTLGELPARQSFDVLKRIVIRHIEDPWFQMAVLSAATQDGIRWFQAVTKDPAFVQEQSKGREDFLRRVGSIVGARQSGSEVNAVLTLLDKDLDEKWQVAILEGLAEGLKRGSRNRIRLSSVGQERILKLVEARSSHLSESAFEVAASTELEDSTRLRNLIKKATESARSKDAEVELRVKSIRVLGLDPTHSTNALLGMLLAPQEPEEVQMAAARALLSLSDLKSRDLLLEKWQMYTTPVREVVLEGLFKNPGNLQAFLDAIKSEKVKPWSLSRARRTQLLRSEDEEVRKRAETLLAGISNDRESIIEKYRPSVLRNGDVERGKQVFNKKCSRCHKIGGVEVGPDLLTITKWGKEQLLENILDPSANIVPGYEEYAMITKDGSMITGVMVQESETTVTLRRSKGEEDTVLRSNIVSLRAATVSAMPEGLEDEIRVEQMTDLLEYLMSLRGAVTTKTGIHGHF